MSVKDNLIANEEVVFESEKHWVARSATRSFRSCCSLPPTPSAGSRRTVTTASWARSAISWTS